jgi:hypothetical protein
MTEVAQLKQTASRLSPSDRAELLDFLLAGLDETHHWVDDAEVIRRRDELNSGEVIALNLEEFRSACGR